MEGVDLKLLGAVKGAVQGTIRAGEKAIVVKFELADVMALMKTLADPPSIPSA
jgi:hypothetical protein